MHRLLQHMHVSHFGQGTGGSQSCSFFPHSFGEFAKVQHLDGGHGAVQDGWFRTWCPMQHHPQA